jgi:hypothetical protein
MEGQEPLECEQPNLPEWAVVILEGLVVGMILHLVVAPHRSTVLDQAAVKVWHRVGTVAGVLIIIWFAGFAGV